MLPVSWSQEAQEDLAEIQFYIAQDNPSAAFDLRDLIERGAECLPFMPFAFRAGRIAGTREYLVHPNYILVYRIGHTAIEILRVIHGRRQYPE